MGKDSLCSHVIPSFLSYRVEVLRFENLTPLTPSIHVSTLWLELMLYENEILKNLVKYSGRIRKIRIIRKRIAICHYFI